VRIPTRAAPSRQCGRLAYANRELEDLVGQNLVVPLRRYDAPAGHHVKASGFPVGLYRCSGDKQVASLES